MLRVLLQTRLIALWNSITGRLSSSGKKRSIGMKILIGIFAVYVIAALLGSVGGMFYVIAEPLVKARLGWLYFAIAGLMCVALNFIGSIFATQAQIFDAKDNELLLSMPIPPSYILASRLLLLLFINIVYTLFVMLPVGVVYCLFASVSVPMVIAFILAALLLPFFSMAITCVCSWLIGLITLRMRHKNLITTILMLAFFIGYFFIYSNLQNYLTKLVKNGAAFGDAIRKAFPPVYLFGSAIGNMNWFDLIIFALWCLLPFALVYILLSRSFLKIATAKKNVSKVKYKEKAMNVSSAKLALLKKELARFCTMPLYVLNCGFGVVMEIVLAGALIIKGPEVLSLMVKTPEITKYFPILLCGILCMCSVMTNTTSPSISLEGRNLWILKANPINPNDVFFAKVGANLIVGFPPIIIAAAVSWITVPMSILQGALILILPLLVQIFAALWGLAANLWLPSFDWINETAVIKQSASSIVGMLGALAIAAIPVIVYVLALKNIILADNFLLICIVFFMALIIGLTAYIMTTGKRLFEKM